MQNAEVLLRIGELEKRCARFRIVSLGLSAAIAILLLVAAAPHKVVEATGFILRDDAGKIRARFDLAAASQRPALIFYDDAGKQAIDIGTSNNLAALVMYDHTAVNRIDLGLDPSGSPSLVLSRVPPRHAAVVVARGDKQTVLRAP